MYIVVINFSFCFINLKNYFKSYLSYEFVIYIIIVSIVNFVGYYNIFVI